MAARTSLTSSTASHGVTKASTSTPVGSASGDELVNSLHEFLTAWTKRKEPRQQQVDRESAETNESINYDYFAHFPSPLPSPLPRSFRPCEMVPGVYLGSWQDVGTDVAALTQRLLQATATTTTTVNPNKSNNNNSIGGNESRQRSGIQAPQQMALLVRACPLPDVTKPQLELHVARARRSGVRRSVVAAPSKASTSTSIRPAPVGLARSAESTGGASSISGEKGLSIPVHDIVVTRFRLTELYERVCAAAAENENGNNNNYDKGDLSNLSHVASSAVSATQWLCPATPTAPVTRASSRSSGAIPPSFSSAEWHLCIHAVQEILLADYTAATAACVPSTWQEPVLRYWRLVLPVLDAPAVRIQQYFALTSLVLHAALTLSDHPKYETWAAAASAARTNDKTEHASSAEDDGVTHDESSVGGSGETKISSSTTLTEPCVVVHCQAGKSRSVSFVAAFILQEWMLWYRTTEAKGSVVAKSSTEQVAVSRQGTTARRLVDTVMSHLRARRLCIDVNVGFDAQLYAMVDTFVSGL